MMKKMTWMMFLAAASCGMPPADDMTGAEGVSEESSAELRPGDTFSATIPAAPRASGRRNFWQSGAPLIPAGFSPQTFYYVYAGDVSRPGVVVAYGFDVASRVLLFEYDVHTSDVPSFITEVNDTIQLQGLLLRDSGGAGNITPKCCRSPGTPFSEQAWGQAYLTYEAHLVMLR